MPRGRGTSGGARRVDGIVVRKDRLANRGDGAGHTIDNEVVERGDQQEGQEPDDDEGGDREADDPPHHAHDVGRADPPRPPSRLAGADAEQPVEEATVPRQADGDRLVERVSAAAAEVADRVIAFTALAADEVAGVPACRRFHRARCLTGAGDRRRDGRRPARDRLVRLGDRYGWWGRGDGGSRNAGKDGRGCRRRRRGRRGGGERDCPDNLRFRGRGCRDRRLRGNRGGRRFGVRRCCWWRRLLDPHRVLDAVDQADMGRLRYRLGGGRFGLRLGVDDAFPSPFQEFPAGPAERVAVLVVVPALLADDHALVTSTASGTFDRLTSCTLCVTCAGLSAATSASSRVALMASGSSTATRTIRAKFGDPGSASPAVVEVATPPVSMISTVPPVRVSICAFSPLTVPRMR